MAKDLNILYPEGAKLQIAEKEFLIKPLVFKQRTKLLRMVTEIGIDMAKKYPNLSGGSLKNIEECLKPFCDVAGDRMRAIYAVLLDVDEDWIDNNLELKSELSLIALFLEQNDIPFLLSQVRNIKALAKNQTNLAK